ncbi:MAG: cupin domain-containing protein [Firmicutes bacterium]|jgi:quercetin dioxygenase-like cupin family protein|nr:cupin domain-containing protein [Bacillota bacterium]
MKIIKPLPSGLGPADCFTGVVIVDAVRNPDENSDTGCAHVRFTPGARTAWHKHPKGQTLYVTDGVGYVCQREDAVKEIRAGDVIVTEANEEHWHGAHPKHFMAHLAIHGADEDGNTAVWLEHVSDEEYNNL